MCEYTCEFREKPLEQASAPINLDFGLDRVSYRELIKRYEPPVGRLLPRPEALHFT